MMSVMMMALSEPSVVHLSSHVDLVVASLRFHGPILVLIGSVSHLCVSLLNLPFAHVDICKALSEISMHKFINSLLLLVLSHVSLHIALVHLINSHILVHLSLIDILSSLEFKPSADISLHSVAHVALHSVTLIITLIIALIVAHVAVEVAWIHRSNLI